MSILVCPTVNRPAFRYMIRDHKGNETAAVKEWMNNNNAIPQKYLDEEALYYSQEGTVKKIDEPPFIMPEKLRDREDVLKRAINLTSRKISSLARLAKSTNNVQQVINELNSTLEKMKRYSSDKALLEFIKVAKTINDSTYSWVEKMYSGQEIVTLDKLRKIKEFNESTELLTKINEDLFEGDAFKDYHNLVSEILAKKAQIHDRYIGLSRKTIAQLWAPHFGKLREFEKREAEVRFNQSDYRKKLKEQGKSKSEIAIERDKYIKDELLKIEPYIKVKTEQYVEMLLSKTEDVTGLSAYTLNPKDMGNDVVSLAAEYADRADWAVMQKTNEATHKMKRLLDKFYAQVGKKSNPADQYELFLIKDAEGVNRIVGEFDDKAKIIRSKYKGTAVEELYDYMLELIKEKDKMVPNFAKLGNKLPSANKQTMERLYANGAWTTLKEGVVDIYKLRALDIDFGDIESRLNGNKNAQTVEVLAKDSNKGAEYVPIFYRGKVESADQSLDIPSLLLMDLKNSINYEKKTELFIMLDVLKDTIGEAEVLQRSQVKNLLNISGGNLVLDSAKTSNLYTVLNHLIENRVFGKTLKADPRVAKISNKIKTYTSHVNLILNRFSAPANFLQGSVMNWIETVGGKTGEYTATNRLNASKKYDLDLVNIVKDIGEEVPTSKTNLLVELFNASSDWNGLDNGFVKNNKLKRLLSLRTAHGLQGYTEHAIQSVTMYSILDNIKVLDANGSYLDSKFNPTTDRNKAMSIDEAYSVKDGKLQLDPRVVSTEKTDNVSIKEDGGLFQISNIIRRTNRHLYGNYDSKNRSQFELTLIGNLVTHMRGWLITGIQYHWKGIGKYTKPLTEEELSKLSEMDRKAYELNMMNNLKFNPETNKFEEGTYTTTFKFITRMLRDIKETKAISNTPAIWNTLTEYEKRNIGKMALETAIIIFALVASTMLMAGDGDDEVTDDATKLYLAYTSRRLFSELAAYAPIVGLPEALRTVRSPAISLSTAENLGDFFIQMFNPTEEYEKGPKKGDLKLTHEFFKLVPVASQLDRNTKDALEFLTK